CRDRPTGWLGIARLVTGENRKPHGEDGSPAQPRTSRRSRPSVPFHERLGDRATGPEPALASCARAIGLSEPVENTRKKLRGAHLSGISDSNLGLDIRAE